MAIAYNRKFGTAYEVVGTGKMHSNLWASGGPLGSSSPADMLPVTILRNDAGEFMVCPEDELDDLFQVMTDVA